MKLLNKKNILIFIIILAIFWLGQFFINRGIIDSFIFLNMVLIGINIILAVGLNLVTGYTGQLSLGHAAFMSIGAYTSGILTAKLGMPFLVGIIGAALFSAIAGIIIGIPTLRLKGDYLAIATLGFGEIIRIIGLNNDYIGGAVGLNDIPQYTNWFWLYFAVVATIVIINNFIKSYNGRACISIREDEIASESMGVNTTYYKVLVFTIGALFAGIAGALYANFFYFIRARCFWLYEIHRYISYCSIWRIGEYSWFSCGGYRPYSNLSFFTGYTRTKDGCLRCGLIYDNAI